MEIEEKVAKAEAFIETLIRQGAIVAWSSGKDSSVNLSLVLDTARRLSEAGETYPGLVLTHANTGIENPEIAAHAAAELHKIWAYAEKHNIPLTVRIATPALRDLWSVNIVGGRSIPTFPNSKTRDCSVNLKVIPMQKMRKQLLSEMTQVTGESPVTIIGTRYEESTGRAARMEARGENDFEVRVDASGQRFASPLAYWSTDDVWEYLGYCRGGMLESYSDFEDTFRIYADAGGSSCAVVGDMATEGQKKSTGCGARHGCGLCTAVARDQSLENMIERDERYHYMRGMNRLQRFILATQYDLDRRNWVGRPIENGYIKIEPNTYSAGMQEELLRYALTLDVEESIASRSLGINPRFQLVSLQALVAIDALWSLNGMHPEFHALAIYQDIVEDGQRYYPPLIETFKEVKFPKARYLYVGTEWEGRDWQYSGLRDPLLEAFGAEGGCMGTKRLADGRTVLDINTSQVFDIDLESASLVLQLEMPELLAKYHDGKSCDGSSRAYRYYASLGTLSIAKSQSGTVDEMLRRTAYKAHYGLIGKIDIHRILDRAVSEAEMREEMASRGVMLETDEPDLFEKPKLRL